MIGRTMLAGVLLVMATLPANAQGTGQDPARKDACRDEVSRFSDSFLGNQALPGGRQGARIEGERRDKLRGLLDEARAAAGRGDAEGCLSRLREARSMVREGGVGGGGGGSLGTGNSGGGGSTGSSGLPGGASGPGGTGGTGSSGGARGGGATGGGTGGGGGGAGGGGGGGGG